MNIRTWIRAALLASIFLAGQSSSATAQVFDADCFAGTCNGSKGIPECPDGFDEVGFVLYANSRADAGGSC
ncbi:MAG: hypothetical protein O3A53_01735 [Acidobacteria bacterium]|nr:hypothetical protein [Acidobacteriota bacterium]MDA1233501.1 hypothetical protein [Acidobacteriota bacterium]